MGWSALNLPGKPRVSLPSIKPATSHPAKSAKATIKLVEPAVAIVKSITTTKTMSLNILLNLVWQRTSMFKV